MSIPTGALSVDQARDLLLAAIQPVDGWENL